MISRKRHDIILRHLEQNRYASIHKIVSLVNASEATVRRDFNFLEQEGKIKRVHGGAELIEDTKGKGIINELPFEYRKGVHLEKKRRIAQKAVELCQDDETIMIDGGSTTYQMVEFLREKRLQIITNSLAIADYLVKFTYNSTIVLGGLIYPNSQLILDPFHPEKFLKNYYASKLFIGVSGIDEFGATNTDTNLIQTERAMIAQSKQLIILCDSSKFSRHGNLFLCGYESIHTIITDSGITNEQKDMILEMDVNLIITE